MFLSRHCILPLNLTTPQTDEAFAGWFLCGYLIDRFVPAEGGINRSRPSANRTQPISRGTALTYAPNRKVRLMNVFQDGRSCLTTGQSTRCGPLPLAGKTGCFAARLTALMSARRHTLSWRLPERMVRSPSVCVKCFRTLRIPYHAATAPSQRGSVAAAYTPSSPRQMISPRPIEMRSSTTSISCPIARSASAMSQPASRSS